MTSISLIFFGESKPVKKGDQLSSCHVQPFVSRCRYVLVKALQGGSSHGWLGCNGRTQADWLWWLPHGQLAPWLFQCYVSSMSLSFKMCAHTHKKRHTNTRVYSYPTFNALFVFLFLLGLNCTEKVMTKGLIHYFTRPKTWPLFTSS